MRPAQPATRSSSSCRRRSGCRFCATGYSPAIATWIQPERSRIRLQPDLLIVKSGRNGLWSYTLDEGAQRAVALRLTPGLDPGWCTVAAAKAHGIPPSTARTDLPGVFTGGKSGPPASCPAQP
jgi:hypothetical protein